LKTGREIAAFYQAQSVPIQEQIESTLRVITRNEADAEELLIRLKHAASAQEIAK